MVVFCCSPGYDWDLVSWLVRAESSGHFQSAMPFKERVHIGYFKLPWYSDGKESACNVGDLGSTRKIPGEGTGNPLQYSCLENSVNRGA